MKAVRGSCWVGISLLIGVGCSGEQFESGGDRDASALGGSAGASGAAGGSAGSSGSGGVAGSGNSGNGGNGANAGSSGGVACSPSSACPSGAYCDYPSASCGLDGKQGICVQKPSGATCPGTQQPVCGCDAAYHDNDCLAHAAGTDDAPGFCTFCPPGQPPDHSPCFNEDMYCTYGSGPRLDCRAESKCLEGQWQSSAPGCPGVGGCPLTKPEAVGECTTVGMLCTYGATLCGCVDCPGVGACTPPPEWVCAPPPSGGGCPVHAPNAGQPCTGTQSCQYGSCDLEIVKDISCQANVWQWADPTCPQ